MGVEQNSPIFTPGVANHASSDATGEVAGGDELAARGSRTAGDLGDHGLRNAVHREHELGADGEELVVERGVARDHLGEVVAGREHRSVRLHDDHLGRVGQRAAARRASPP